MIMMLCMITVGVLRMRTAHRRLFMPAADNLSPCRLPGHGQVGREGGDGQDLTHAQKTSSPAVIGFQSYMRALSDIQPNPIYLSGGGNRTSVGHSKSRFVELHEMDLRLKPDNARKLDTCNRSDRVVPQCFYWTTKNAFLFKQRSDFLKNTFSFWLDLWHMSDDNHFSNGFL